MNKRLTIKTRLLQCLVVVENLMMKESDDAFILELSGLKELLSDAIESIDTDETNSGKVDYSKIIVIFDWVLKTLATKEIWDSFQ